MNKNEKFKKKNRKNKKENWAKTIKYKVKTKEKNKLEIKQIKIDLPEIKDFLK